MALKRWIASIFPFLFSIFGVVRAQELIPQEQLEPALGWVSVVLGKNIATFDGFILVILLTIFMTIVLYQAIKRSGVFRSDDGVSHSVEAVIAVIIAVLVMRFMPIEYFVILLVGFLILAALLTFYTLFKMVTGTLGESGFSQAVFVLITGFGFFATGTLMANFRTTLSASGFKIPVEVVDFGNIFMAIGIFIILLGSLGLIGRFYTSSKGLISGFRRDVKSTKNILNLESQERGARTTAQKVKVTRREINLASSQFYNEIQEAKELHRELIALANAGNRPAANLARRAERWIKNLEILARREIILLRIRQKRLVAGRSLVDIEAKIRELVRRIAIYQGRTRSLAYNISKLRKAPARTRPKKANAKTRTRRKITRRTAGAV